jgi:D-glycero-D-manno-heptose 1,7-bisphosphate phosphatase
MILPKPPHCQHYQEYKIPKLVLLDRDGVINEDVGAPGVLHPQQLILTPRAGQAIAKLKQAGCWIAMITNQSCVGKGLITPHQLDIIHDHLQELLLQEHPEARIDQIYSCTSFHHDPKVDSGNRSYDNNNVKDDPRRKPQPGMIYEAMADFGITSTNINDCCCWVGDTVTDLQAATFAGIQHRYLVATGYGQGLLRGLVPPSPPIWMESLDIPEMDPALLTATTAATTTTKTALATTLPFYYCQNLAHAVDWILEPHLV